MFQLIQDIPRVNTNTTDLLKCVGKTVSILGCYVTYKHVRTVTGHNMAFGTFLDNDGDFFDTTHFPNSFRLFPFNGMGVYLIKGKVVEEFDFTNIEVLYMEKLAIVPDPRVV